MGEGSATTIRPLAKKRSENAKWIAFISYTHGDDEGYGGLVRQLANTLSAQLTRFGLQGANIYLDTESSYESTNFRKGVKEVMKDLPVFIPVLSTSWLNSKECLFECEQFLICAHGRDYESDDWKLPEDRALFLPLTFEDLNTLKKANSDPKMNDLFFAPGLQIRDISPGWGNEKKFKAIVTKLRKTIIGWWEDRQWQVDGKPSGDETGAAQSDVSSDNSDTVIGPSLADDLVARHRVLLPRAEGLVPPDWTRSMAALDKAATGSLEILDLLLQRLQPGEYDESCQLWFNGLGVSAQLKQGEP